MGCKPMGDFQADSMPREARRENEMNYENKIDKFGPSARAALAGLVLLFLVAVPVVSVADDGPPAFTFNDRCVPYEVEHNFMRANGVEPSRILTTFGGEVPEDPTAGNAPWTVDYESDGETPKPCDEFHTHKRRTRYEGCHFYDGKPCYFTTNGQMDQDAFTDDAAGRRAFEIAEHFVIYEVQQNFGTTEYDVSFCVQNGRPNPFISNPFACQGAGGTWTTEQRTYSPAPVFTDPFAGGFAVGTQTKLMNARGSYFTDNPLGLWKIGFLQFTGKSIQCINGPPPGPFPPPPPDPADCQYLNDLTAQNGQNSQMLGMPLIYTGDEIFELTNRGLLSLRYRIGADGVPGGAEGPRYILCPVHEDPSQGSLLAGQDIIQAYPTHIEFQPPSALVILPELQFPPPPAPPIPVQGRGHVRVSVAFPFGPTPPPGKGPFAEQDVYDQFDCLQRTGSWCSP